MKRTDGKKAGALRASVTFSLLRPAPTKIEITTLVVKRSVHLGLDIKTLVHHFVTELNAAKGVTFLVKGSLSITRSAIINFLWLSNWWCRDNCPPVPSSPGLAAGGR